MARTRVERTATYTIYLEWSMLSKCWHIRAADRYGTVIAGQRAKTTRAIEQHEVALLLRALRDELESFLPF